MVFLKLAENPPETTLITTVLGLLLTEDLTTADLTILGRLLIYLGEVVTTIAVLQATLELEAATPGENETKTAADATYVMIKQLQQQNQNLQDQIWALQEKRQK